MDGWMDAMQRDIHKRVNGKVAKIEKATTGNCLATIMTNSHLRDLILYIRKMARFCNKGQAKPGINV